MKKIPEKQLSDNIRDISYYEHTAGVYLAQLDHRAGLLYGVVLFFITAVFASLPFCKVDITVRVPGMVRPVSERTEIRSSLAGIIENIYCKEGDQVSKNAVILRLKEPGIKSRQMANDFRIAQHRQFIHDLEILTRVHAFSNDILNQLHAPLYKEQFKRFRHQLSEQESYLQKANKEVEANTSLAKEKIISSKEFFDIQMQQQKVQAAYQTAIQEQLSNWQEELVRNQLELAQYNDQLNQLIDQENLTMIKASVSGIVQGISTRYAGGSLQANEPICMISPDDGFIAECYAATKDIGLIHPGQKVIYQLDAFEHHYFGTFTGRVLAVDNDFTLLDNKPVFKIRCLFNCNQLLLKNGYSATLKKGLTFQARFHVARRSLWQLLFDHLGDWLDPSALQK